MFSGVDNFVIEKIHRKTFIAKTILDHLKALEIQFETYFILNIDLQKNSLDSIAVLDWLKRD